jgi:hypothetical protein
MGKDVRIRMTDGKMCEDKDDRWEKKGMFSLYSGACLGPCQR